MTQELILFVTAPNQDEAHRLAEALVGERLAACVNLIPAIESVYRWEGEIIKDQEVLLLIKTTDNRYAELENRILALHSYTTPEIIALQIARGSKNYLDWLKNSVEADEIS
jgi:periplasmic divalent cation tolerance protein